VNVDFTAALFDWAAARGVRGVVYISGFNLLRRPLDPVITEDHAVAPVTPYAITKYEGELALAKHADRGRFRGVCLRLSSPIPFAYTRLHDTVVKTWIDRARAGRPLTVFGRGDRTQDFVSTEDIASAVVGALRGEARGTYNVASGTALSMRELASLIAAQRPVPIQFEGDDPSASERWDVSVARAGADLGYAPKYTARAAIERLLAAIP
jgi:UDP-glucose 4-epimerase